MFLTEGLQPIYIMAEFSERDAGIYLCRGDIGVTHHSAYALNGKSRVQTHNGETVACTVKRDMPRDATPACDERDVRCQCAIYYRSEDTFPTVVIAAYDFRCFGEHSHLVGYVCLMTACKDPGLTADGANISVTEVVDVGKGEPCQCREDEYVAIESLPAVSQFASH